MKIYIASSWKNQHAVEMLTDIFRKQGHEVMSFVENNFGEGVGGNRPLDFEKWVQTERATQAFDFDMRGATESHLVVYVGPSGTDAWAEVVAAWASGVPVYGLWAKGEQAGLMRRMVHCWFTDFRALVHAISN